MFFVRFGGPVFGWPGLLLPCQVVLVLYHGNFRNAIANTEIPVICNYPHIWRGAIVQNFHISKTIKALCEAKNITISTLLADCNLTKSFIYDLEKRKSSPSCEKMSRIADYLDCSVDYLLGRTDNPLVSTETPNSVAIPFQPTGQLKELVDVYSDLDASQQNMVLTFAKFLAAGGTIPLSTEEMLAEAK